MMSPCSRLGMPKRATSVIAAALAAWTLGGPGANAKPAITGDAAITADVRCLLMGFFVAQDPDPKTKSYGQSAALFYWGRLQGRGAIDGLQGRIVQQAGWATPDAIADAAQTCGAEMKAVGDDMKALGERLEALKHGGR
jgi:hypothetical protein